MNTIKVTLLSIPSHSKGWARYSLTGATGRIVESSTGNSWVSASHEGQAEDGCAITLVIQVSLKEGKYNKQTVYTQTVTLIATPGATEEIEYRPGSQGARLKIEGAARK